MKTVSNAADNSTADTIVRWGGQREKRRGGASERAETMLCVLKSEKRVEG